MNLEVSIIWFAACFNKPHTDHNISFDVVGDLTHEDLKDMGIVSVGDRMRIIIAAKKLRKGTSMSDLSHINGPTIPLYPTAPSGAGANTVDSNRPLSILTSPASLVPPKSRVANLDNPLNNGYNQNPSHFTPMSSRSQNLQRFQPIATPDKLLNVRSDSLDTATPLSAQVSSNNSEHLTSTTKKVRLCQCP